MLVRLIVAPPSRMTVPPPQTARAPVVKVAPLPIDSTPVPPGPAAVPPTAVVPVVVSCVESPLSVKRPLPPPRAPIAMLLSPVLTMRPSASTRVPCRLLPTVTVVMLLLLELPINSNVGIAVLMLPSTTKGCTAAPLL